MSNITAYPCVVDTTSDEFSVDGTGQQRIALGVCLSLLSCCLTNSGLLIEKVALQNEAARRGGMHHVQFYRVRGWWLGFAVFMVSQARRTDPTCTHGLTVFPAARSPSPPR